MSDPRQSKSVKSEVGMSQITKPRSKRNKKPYYQLGKKLHSFKLNYCSVLGLIEAGILPKPPLWDHARMLKPAKRCKSCGHNPMTVQPKKIRLEDPNSLVAPKEYELFDLAEVLDDNEEDE
jgi:hypothetical protein